MLLFFWPDSDNLFIAYAYSLAVLGLNDLLRAGFSFCYAFGDPAGDPLGDVFSSFCSNVKCLGEVVGFFPLGDACKVLLLSGRLPPKKDCDPLVLSGLFTLKNEPDLFSAGISDAFLPKRGDALGLVFGYAEFYVLGETEVLVLWKDSDPLELSGLFTLKNEPDLFSVGISDAFLPIRGEALGLVFGYSDAFLPNRGDALGLVLV